MSSDSDSDHVSASPEASDVEDVEIEEQEEELVPIGASEVPELLKNLESSDLELFETTVGKLIQILDHQRDLFHELIVPDVARLFKIANDNKADEERRRPLVEFLSQIATSDSEEGRAAIYAHLAPFVAFMLNPDMMDRMTITYALDRMLGEDDAFEPKLVGVLKDTVLVLPSESDAGAYDATKNSLEVFRHALLYQHEQLRAAFAKAGAIEFTINLTGAPDPSTREAAIQCLESALTAKDELQEHFALRNPDGEFTDPNYFHGMFVLPVIDLLRDDEESVVNAALSFLQSDDTEATAAFIFTHDDALASLATCFAKKNPETLGAPIDWLVGRYAEVSMESVTEGFRKAWSGEDVKTETKIGMLRGLSNTFDKPKLAAGSGGMADFVLRLLNDTEHRKTLLAIMPKLLEDDRAICQVLVKEGGIPRLLDIFEQGATIEERCSAASVLGCFPQASYPDEKDPDNFISLRTIACTALSADDVLPRIVAALKAPEQQIATAAFGLLAEILKTDDWFDEDVPAPIKDRVVTPELIELVISSFKVSELAPSAVNVLAEVCWAYKRGFEIVQKAFEPHIPQADAVFFASLYGESTYKLASRKRYHVVDAAIKAGALPRILSILEEPISSVESCKVTVEAFRVILCSDETDRDVGRTNARIPVLLAYLINDGSFKALLQATLMVRLLSDDDNPKALVSWSDALANETIVRQLVKALGTEQKTFELPYGDMPVEELLALSKEFEKKVEAEADRFKKAVSVATEAISGLLPLFKPFTSILAGAVLTRSNTCDENCVIELLGKLATAGDDEEQLEPLVKAAKDLLALPTPPTVDKLQTWIRSDEGLATSFYLAGVLPFLTARAVIPPTEDDVEPDLTIPNEIIDTLVALATNVKGDVSRKREVQKSFFSSATLVSVAVSTVKKLDSYEKYTAQVMATNLYKLSKGYPDAVPTLVEQDIFPSLLKMFDDEDLDPEDYGPLLGWMADTDKEALVNMLKAHISQLQPPAEPQGGNSGKGGKKKKKKKYSPRISKAGVLMRLAVLSSTSSTAKEIVLEAGGFAVAVQMLEDSDTELWIQPLQIFKSLFESEDVKVLGRDSLAPALPRIKAIWSSESTPESVLPPLLRFLQAFIKADGSQVLLEADWDLLLVKKLSEEPSSVGEMRGLVDTVSILFGSDDAGRAAVLARFRERMEDEATCDSEHNWGTTHAIRCLAIDAIGEEEFARAILEAGALDYAVKLLTSGDVQYATKGAALSTTLARSIPNDARPLIESKGIPQLVTEGRQKLADWLKAPFQAPEGADESEVAQAKEDHEDKLRHRSDWDGHWDKFSRILGGETIDLADYEEYYWF